MLLLDLSLPTPEENLALDEALLLESEAAHAEPGQPHELLRFWESATHFVVLGVAGRIADETRREDCESDEVPILRRGSGGGTVLQGPGCLNYSLVLSLDARPQLRPIHGSYRSILDRVGVALGPAEIARRGTSDLAVGELKFSGNAQKRKRHTLLHHGTILYSFDTARMSRYLKEPAKQPEYRENRPHGAFVGSLSLKIEEIKKRLAAAWNAVEPWGKRSLPEIGELIELRYGNPKWTERF